MPVTTVIPRRMEPFFDRYAEQTRILLAAEAEAARLRDLLHEAEYAARSAKNELSNAASAIEGRILAANLLRRNLGPAIYWSGPASGEAAAMRQRYAVTGECIKGKVQVWIRSEGAAKWAVHFDLERYNHTLPGAMHHSERYGGTGNPARLPLMIEAAMQLCQQLVDQHADPCDRYDVTPGDLEPAEISQFRIGFHYEVLLSGGGYHAEIWLVLTLEDGTLLRTMALPRDIPKAVGTIPLRGWVYMDDLMERAGDGDPRARFEDLLAAMTREVAAEIHARGDIEELLIEAALGDRLAAEALKIMADEEQEDEIVDHLWRLRAQQVA